MAISLINARRAGDDLAAGRVSASDQSLYLTASFLIWLVPAYLFLFPAPRTADPEFFWTVWLAELAIVVLFCIAGIGYCLRKCRVDPARNFLIDFSCLNAPVSLVTLLVVWGLYYLVEAAFALVKVESSRAYDVVRLFASTGAVLVVFARIGAHMSRVASLRAGRDGAVERPR
jgi:hypothetical protein